MLAQFLLTLAAFTVAKAAPTGVSPDMDIPVSIPEISSGSSTGPSQVSDIFTSEPSRNESIVVGIESVLSGSSEPLVYIQAAPPAEDNKLNFVPPYITYSTINNDYTCKSFDQVSSEFAEIKSKGITGVRVYGVDCNAYWTVQPAARQNGLKIMQGFYITQAGTWTINQAVTDLVNWIHTQNGGNWDVISAVTVGNEAVTFGWVTPEQLLGKIRDVRGQLYAAGYRGPITTAEIPSVYINNPMLCNGDDTVDFVGVNAHPYFDAGKTADQSEPFMISQVEVVKQACPGKRVMVVETGYPSSGNTHGNQVPSQRNQAVALTQIFNALNGDVVMFTMHDDRWKQPGPFGVEQSFGMFHLLR